MGNIMKQFASAAGYDNASYIVPSQRYEQIALDELSAKDTNIFLID